MRALVGFTGLVGAGSALASTLVGHPVPTEFADGAGLTYTAAVLPVSTVVYDHCDGADETAEADEVLDPVAGDALVLTEGQHCRVRVNLADRLELYGDGPSGSSFALSLDVGWIELEFDPPVTVPPGGASGGTQIVLGFEDWVTASLLDLDPSEHVGVGATHPLHDSLRNAIRYGSSAW